MKALGSCPFDPTLPLAAPSHQMNGGAILYILVKFVVCIPIDKGFKLGKLTFFLRQGLYSNTNAEKQFTSVGRKMPLPYSVWA